MRVWRFWAAAHKQLVRAAVFLFGESNLNRTLIPPSEISDKDQVKIRKGGVMDSRGSPMRPVRDFQSPQSSRSSGETNV